MQKSARQGRNCFFFFFVPATLSLSLISSIATIFSSPSRRLPATGKERKKITRLNKKRSKKKEREKTLQWRRWRRPEELQVRRRERFTRQKKKKKREIKGNKKWFNSPRKKEPAALINALSARIIGSLKISWIICENRLSREEIVFFFGFVLGVCSLSLMLSETMQSSLSNSWMRDD